MGSVVLNFIETYCEFSFHHLLSHSQCPAQVSIASTSPRKTSNRKSDAHSELYQALLKMFVDADTNFDGLVSRESFSKLLDKAASIPRAYGYAPPDSELYKTEEERDLARKKMFDSMDLKSTGVITFDEWYRFSMEHIAAKTSTIAPHPILDHGSKEQYVEFIKKATDASSAENLEMYWFLV